MLDKILKSIKVHSHEIAFHFGEDYYTYLQLAEYISGIQDFLEDNTIKGDIIGIVTHNDIYTYASILATWFSGCCFVPLGLNNPQARNQLVIDQVNPKYILSSNLQDSFQYSETIICTRNIKRSRKEIAIRSSNPHDLMYILFTSGSTGTPKGVKINRENLSSFINGFIDIGYQINNQDRFLQIYDLTFDASIHCYLLPLCLGASVYPVPQDGMKYLNAYKVLRDYKITFAKMPPSTIAYLQPYFSNINLPGLRYSLFGGEGLPVSLIEQWKRCVPNAEVHNVYGPTEATVNCLVYKIRANYPLKEYQGTVSLGKTFGDTIAMVVDEELNALYQGCQGELCVSGSQITPGYWNDDDKNSRAFFYKKMGNEEKRFYRTGDMVFIDEAGDIMYAGRKDNQIQINGFRVEMGEIEKHMRDVTGKAQVAAIVKADQTGNYRIFAFVEGKDMDTGRIAEYLASKLPAYMLPEKIIILPEFPLNVSGKLNKKVLEDKVE